MFIGVIYSQDKIRNMSLVPIDEFYDDPTTHTHIRVGHIPTLNKHTYGSQHMAIDLGLEEEPKPNPISTTVLIHANDLEVASSIFRRIMENNFPGLSGYLAEPVLQYQVALPKVEEFKISNEGVMPR